MFILLFVFYGYITLGDYKEATGKIFYCTSWSFLYLAFNCDLYKWVFAVHRINLYGGEITVAQFRSRQALSYYIYLVISGILMLANMVVTMSSAFIPRDKTSTIL